jgi:sugar O-acyltransferase (sialic acid O-acetyltransferase NeuD family)
VSNKNIEVYTYFTKFQFINGSLMTDLLIFPYNGNGIEAIDCLTDQYNFIGFVDDLPDKQGSSFTSHPVFPREALIKYKNAKVLAVPGGPTSFKEKEANISSLNLSKDRFVQLIHPSASVSKYATIGFNALIMAGVVITPGARIGNHICILPNTVIHHDVKVADYCWIGSNVVVAGGTAIGKNSFIGSASSVINNIQIGEGSLIGIGSNVIRSVNNHSKVGGNPAKPLK